MPSLIYNLTYLSVCMSGFVAKYWYFISFEVFVFMLLWIHSTLFLVLHSQIKWLWFSVLLSAAEFGSAIAVLDKRVRIIYWDFFFNCLPQISGWTTSHSNLGCKKSLYWGCQVVFLQSMKRVWYSLICRHKHSRKSAIVTRICAHAFVCCSAVMLIVVHNLKSLWV